ncbi:MAG: hypothetical protein HFH48_07520 [Lachnospiraceae bacterium]|nr:hypothetical protein [Lachnospiraceae bacterium]
MKTEKNKILIFKYSIVSYLILAAWGLLSERGSSPAAFNLSENMEKYGKTRPYTSVDFRYENQFRSTLNRYRSFQNLYQPDYSTPVPGLENTDVLGENCSQMVPQGICIAGDYMLVTAYDNGMFYGKKTKQKVPKISRSVLYVLSNQNPENRKFLTAVILPDINHVGGAAFDGERVWIAKSTTRQCSVISYDTIERAVNSGESSYELLAYDGNVSCGMTASFVTWHEGKLWVGTYVKGLLKKGELRGFRVVRKEREGREILTLEQQEEILIPGFANGAAFLKAEGKTYLAVVSSMGRYFDSEIYLYEICKDVCSGKNLYRRHDSVSFPPMAEELVWEGTYTYFLFESSATCYSTLSYQKCSYPVDRICAVSTQQLLTRGKDASRAALREERMEKTMQRKMLPIQEMGVFRRPFAGSMSAGYQYKKRRHERQFRYSKVVFRKCFVYNENMGEHRNSERKPQGTG